MKNKTARTGHTVKLIRYRVVEELSLRKNCVFSYEIIFTS